MNQTIFNWCHSLQMRSLSIEALISLWKGSALYQAVVSLPAPGVSNS